MMFFIVVIASRKSTGPGVSTTLSVSHGIGEFIQQYVGFAIEDTIALQNGGLSDGLSQMTLARAARPEKQRVFPLANEGACGQIEDQAAVHLRVEGEVEAVERSVGVPKAGLFAATFEPAV